MRPGYLAALLIGTSLVAGCTVGPDYVRPDAALPQQYLLNHDEAARRTDRSQTDLDAWWQAFDDPQLTRFVTLALNQNLDLGQAHARVIQAQAGLQAADAELRPSGSIEGSATRAYQSLETPLGQVLSAAPGFDRYNNAYETNLNASWELDLFGGLKRQRDAALAEYQAAEAAAIATRLSVAAQTADIYLSIRGLQTRRDIAAKQVATLAKRLSLVRMRHDKELAAELDVRQAEGALAQERAFVSALEESLDAAMNAMDVMLGSAPGTHREALSETTAIPDVPPVAQMGTPRDLLQRRPDIIVAERRLAAANARIGSAMADYYPRFSLSGLIGSATTVSSGNLFSHDASQSAGILGLHWRLFDFGRIDAQIDLAKGREAEMLLAYRQTALKATEDVENSFSALMKRETEVHELTRSEASLDRARQLTAQAYRKGVLSLIEVLRADENLLRISDARALARTEAAHAAVASYKALGGGWSVTPLGCGTDEVWSRLVAGHSGIRRVPEELTEGTGTAIAGRVPDLAEDPQLGYDPESVIDARDRKKMDRFIEFAMVAVDEAIRSGRLDTFDGVTKTTNRHHHRFRRWRLRCDRRRPSPLDRVVWSRIASCHQLRQIQYRSLAGGGRRYRSHIHNTRAARPDDSPPP